jgi:hypothetical protein
MAETRFEGTSPVARYWLTRCEGFAVRGGRTGVVESLIRAADPHATAWLVVRTRGRRRQTVPVDAVATVDPAERVLVVQGPEPRLRPAVRAATAAGGRTAARSAQHVRTASGTAARAVGPRARTGAQAVAPLARTGGHRVRTALGTGLRAAAPVVEQARSALAVGFRAAVATLSGALRRIRIESVPRAVKAAGTMVIATLVQSFRSLAAEARYPKPYVPAKRSARSLTSSDAGRPTTFR